VILLDLMMPPMDGWEFQWRQSADLSIASIPTIVLSGSKLPTGAKHQWQSLSTCYELSSIIIAESACALEFWKSALGPTYAHEFRISAPPHGSGRREGH
jgi:CheY-like chemotaxis protein